MNNPGYGAGRNTYIENPLALNVDRAIKVTASQAIDRITVNGGHLHSRGAIFEHAGVGVLTDMLFTGACKLQTAGTTVAAGAGTTTNLIYGDRVLGPQVSVSNPTA